MFTATLYSKAGTDSDGCDARFDKFEGHISITQWDDHGQVTDVVVLSVNQIKELIEFVQDRAS